MHFGWKMPFRANFWRFLVILSPWNCDIVVLTPKGMQYLQKHAFWDITRQNRSSGLTPSCADEQTKKAQTINISPLPGAHPPWTDRHAIWDIEWRPRRNHPCKFCFNRLRGFSVAAPPKVPFPILFERPLPQFCTIVQTVIYMLLNSGFLFLKTLKNKRKR